MKFLAFVDLHGSNTYYEQLAEKSSKADFIVCAGDFTFFEVKIEKWIKKISRLGKRIFLVHGNHEEESTTELLCRKYDNISFMHGKVLEFQEVAVIGWGGGGFMQRDGEFEAWERSERSLLSNYSSKKTIFICHAPFYKTELDRMHDEHRGNKSFRKFVKDYHIDVGICGHFHENAGKEDRILSSRVFNPGPSGKIITL